MEGDSDQIDEPVNPVGAVPGLARVAAGAWMQGAVWGIGAAVKAGGRLGQAATSAEEAAKLLDDVRYEALGGLRRILGAAEEVSPASSISDAAAAVKPQRGQRDDPREEKVRSLRERGAELLERAADVSDEVDPVHPGFSRIVDQLAPDEARILKLLINEGGRGIVYVNKAAPFGIGARVIARRLSLIGREAGCLHPELVPAYLDNLVRLGLAAIRRDPLPDEHGYQVIEAQPEVVAAVGSAGGGVFRGQVSRRSVHLTEFGRTFCQVCFPAEHLTGEFAAIEIEPAATPQPVESAGLDDD